MFGGGKDNADCPFWRGPCQKEKCRMWVQIRGMNPNTGEEIDQWNCSFFFLPMLLIENSHMSRQTGAAVESFRNEVKKQQDTINRAAAANKLLSKG